MKIKGITFYRSDAITNREKIRHMKWQEEQQGIQNQKERGR